MIETKGCRILRFWTPVTDCFLSAFPGLSYPHFGEVLGTFLDIQCCIYSDTTNRC